MTTAEASQVAKLARKVRRLEGCCCALAALLVSLPLLSALASGTPEVLRVKGLIVEDAEGRERVLIGAPVPDAIHRIRTDDEAAKATWGAAYPNMDWYAKLNHSANGILILDENGHDRVAIGDTPDPNVGRRIAASSGITINDEKGYERSGWGYFPKLNRVGLGLDRRDGEGLNLLLHEDGTSGVLIRNRDGSRRTFVGHAKPKHFATGSDHEVHGLVLRDRDGIRVELNGLGHRGVTLPNN